MSVDAAPGGLLLQKQQFLDVRRKLDTISTEHPVFGETLARSLAVVRRALDEFGGPTGAEGLAISFNGGKDACVVLYLLLLVLAERDQLGLLSKTTEGKVRSDDPGCIRVVVAFVHGRSTQKGVEL